MTTSKPRSLVLPKYRGLSPSRRMDEAVRLVQDGTYNQSEASRFCGISRSRLNKRLQSDKLVQAEAEQRSIAARAERAGMVYEPVNELRRVPPLVEFNELYFDNVLCVDCADARHETPEFHREMMRAFDDQSIKRLLVNLPPYHAKSTITMRSVLKDVCADPNSRTAIITKSQGLAKDAVRQIRRHLQDPDLYLGASRNLIDDWGPFFEGGSTNSEQLYVGRRSSGERDPTVQAFGIGQAIYGRRWDKARLDDVFDMKNSVNPDMVQFHLKWITSEVESRVGKAGEVDIMGTRVGPQDGYSFLQKLPGYHVIRYPAILDENDELTLWPEHFDMAAARLKRGTMTPQDWQLLYQNAETLGEFAHFTPEMLEKAHDQSRFLGEYKPSWAGVIGLDPAGGGKQSGYTALFLLAVDLETGERHVVDIVNALQMKAPQLKDQLFAWADQYQGMVRELRVESNGLQSQLVQYNTEILQYMTSRNIKVVPHITSRYNKWDPVFGVATMAPMFYNSQISTPWADVNARRKISELESQLVQFPIGQVTDLYMAMWFAELGCRELFQRAKLPMYNRNFKLPKRLERRRRVLSFGTSTTRSPTEVERGGYGSEFVEPRHYVNVGGDG